MSVYPLGLPGWSELSTWGWDPATGSWYAQLTPDGGDDSNGPQIWLSGLRPPYVTEVELLAAIVHATGAAPVDVLNAMRPNIGNR